MTVNVSKPEVNVREKLAELDKPTGIAGEAMLRAETPQEQFNLIGAGRRNIIINGAMQVAQRGTSVTGLAYGYHTVDRMRSSYNGSVDQATRDAIVESVLTDQYVDGHYVHALKRQYPVSTDTGMHRLNYRVEADDVAKFAGQTLTLSCYMKADSDITFNDSWISIGGTNIDFDDVMLSTVWKRYSFTFVCPPKGSSTYMDIALGSLLANLSDTSVYYAMLQLEVGKVATPFEHRSYHDELLACMRYYRTFYHNFRDVSGFGNDRKVFYFDVTPRLRTVPTVTVTGNGDPRVNDGHASSNINYHGVHYRDANNGSGGWAINCSSNSILDAEL